MQKQEIINEYETAMFAANESGYAGMTAEQVIRNLVERAEAAEEKLAELEQQEPVAYVHPAYLQAGALGFDASLGRLAPAQIPLFTRPAPAADLAELVPDEMTWNQAHSLLDINQCGEDRFSAFMMGANYNRSAILRKIEEDK